jgi:hypothetical protein
MCVTLYADANSIAICRAGGIRRTRSRGEEDSVLDEGRLHTARLGERGNLTGCDIARSDPEKRSACFTLGGDANGTAMRREGGIRRHLERTRNVR